MPEHDPIPHLGDIAEDTITGLTGTVTGHTKWLTGCDTVQLQPRLKADGTIPDGRSVDVPSVRVTECREQANPTPDRGGPRAIARRIGR